MIYAVVILSVLLLLALAALVPVYKIGYFNGGADEYLKDYNKMWERIAKEKQSETPHA